MWLGMWQLDRAQAGNFISWAYALEWPIFAVFVVAVWIREVVTERRKDQPEKPQSSSAKKAEPPPMTSPFEADIVARRRKVDFGNPEATENQPPATTPSPPSR